MEGEETSKFEVWGRLQGVALFFFSGTRKKKLGRNMNNMLGLMIHKRQIHSGKPEKMEGFRMAIAIGHRKVLILGIIKNS